MNQDQLDQLQDQINFYHASILTNHFDHSIWLGLIDSIKQRANESLCDYLNRRLYYIRSNPFLNSFEHELQYLLCNFRQQADQNVFNSGKYKGYDLLFWSADFIDRCNNAYARNAQISQELDDANSESTDLTEYSAYSETKSECIDQISQELDDANSEATDLTEYSAYSEPTSAVDASTITDASTIAEASTIAIGPDSNVTTDGTFSSVSIDGPVSSTIANGPVSSVTTDGPVSSVTTDGPVSSTIAVGPVISTTADSLAFASNANTQFATTATVFVFDPGGTNESSSTAIGPDTGTTAIGPDTGTTAIATGFKPGGRASKTEFPHKIKTSSFYPKKRACQGMDIKC
jgi:hypothetical protein